MAVAKLPESQDLKGLPLRALVALAWRCARRVLPAGAGEVPAYADAQRAALEAAERFANGDTLQGEAAERAADVMAARNEELGDRPDELYSAGYAAAYAAKAASTAAFSLAPPGLPNLGAGPTAERLRGLAGALVGVAAAEATVGHVAAAAGAADGAVYARITRTSVWVESAEGRAACDENARRIWADARKLDGLALGQAASLGEAVDPGPDGPLGPL